MFSWGKKDTAPRTDTSDSCGGIRPSDTDRKKPKTKEKDALSPVGLLHSDVFPLRILAELLKNSLSCKLPFPKATFPLKFLSPHNKPALLLPRYAPGHCWTH